MRRVVISMSKHAISNEKESVGAIIKKFMHVIGINHRLCKWILPCNLGKNIIMAGLPYVGIVYGCNILNALVAREAKGHIMNMVYQLLVITFAMTILYHILDKAGNAMRDNIRYRIIYLLCLCCACPNFDTATAFDRKWCDADLKF